MIYRVWVADCKPMDVDGNKPEVRDIPTEHHDRWRQAAQYVVRRLGLASPYGVKESIEVRTCQLDVNLVNGVPTVTESHKQVDRIQLPQRDLTYEELAQRINQGLATLPPEFRERVQLASYDLGGEGSCNERQLEVFNGLLEWLQPCLAAYQERNGIKERSDS